jgi:hypothetical protein
MIPASLRSVSARDVRASPIRGVRSVARRRGSPKAELNSATRAASSSRSQRVMWSTTVLTLSDLPRTVRGRPLTFVGFPWRLLLS